MKFLTQIFYILTILAATACGEAGPTMMLDEDEQTTLAEILTTDLEASDEDEEVDETFPPQTPTQNNPATTLATDDCSADYCYPCEIFEAETCSCIETDACEEEESVFGF